MLQKAYKLTALPQNLEPNAIYVIAPPNSPYCHIYITNNTGTAHRRVITDQDVQDMINQSLGGSGGTPEVYIVDNISQRNALNPNRPVIAFVVDATGDPTVSSGSATYIYRPSTSQWIKIAEWESLDIVLQWNNIQGRPSSSPSQIDEAVNLRHSHNNLTQLNFIGEDANQNFTYRGNYPLTRWVTVEW